MNDKIKLQNLQALESYLRELLIDNFIGIEIDENFVCRINKFPDTKVAITKL